MAALPPLHLLRIDAPAAGGVKQARSDDRGQPRSLADIFNDDVLAEVDRYLTGNDEDVASLCKWVKAWCIAKGFHCTDDTYRKAIGAFGFVPERGTQPLPPFPHSSSGGWRTLFLNLCGAFQMTTTQFSETEWHNSKKMWEKLDFTLRTDDSQGISFDWHTTTLELLRRDSLTKRALDKFYDALLEVWLDDIFPFAPVQGMRVGPRSRKTIKDMFDNPDIREGPTLLKGANPFSALWVLLRMRGAKRHLEHGEYINSLDTPMYHAIAHGILDQLPWTEVLEETKECLALGANVFYIERRWPELPKLPLPDDYNSEYQRVTVLELALLSRRADLILMLFKNGASEFAPLRLGGDSEGSQYGTQVMAILRGGPLQGKKEEVDQALTTLTNAIYENLREQFVLRRRNFSDKLEQARKSFDAFVADIIADAKHASTAEKFMELIERSRNVEEDAVVDAMVAELERDLPDDDADDWGPEIHAGEGASDL